MLAARQAGHPDARRPLTSMHPTGTNPLPNGFGLNRRLGTQMAEYANPDSDKLILLSRHEPLHPATGV